MSAGGGPRRLGAGARGVRVDVGRDGERAALGVETVRRLVGLVLRAEGVRAASISVTFVSDAAMRRLNTRFLGRRSFTDVMAFGMDGGDGSVVGDVYVSPAAARRTATAEGITTREELGRLVVHGTLHVLGYDHPDGAGRTRSAMWRRQEVLVRRAHREASR